jgi:hypothetical protein
MNRLRRCLLPVLLVASAASSQAAAESHEVCEPYAREAVQAFQAAQQLGCGRQGPRWQDNRDAHYNWCRSAPADWVANERAFRANALRVCRHEPGADACERYATLAVAAQQFNRDHHCGLGGARWGDSHDHHLAWCLTVPAEVADRETLVRNAMVGVCNRNAEHLRCDAYARDAEHQIREAAERGCLFSGPRWTAQYEDHLTWCLTQPAAAAAQEAREREGPLSQCRTQLPVGETKTEACNWTAHIRSEVCTNPDGTPSSTSGTTLTTCGATEDAASERAKAGLPFQASDEDEPAPGTCTFDLDVRPGCGCG